MADYFNAYEKALFERLTAQVTLAKVYQHVPEDTPPPVVIIGDASADAAGSKDGGLYRCEVEIVTVVQGPGRKPLNALMAQVRTALEGFAPALSVGQASGIVASLVSAQLTEDGRTYVGSQRFSAFLQD